MIEVWLFVYEKILDLLLENDYVFKDIGEVSIEDILVFCMIRYYLYVKGCVLNYWFDWKLILVDYLGVNDYL